MDFQSYLKDAAKNTDTEIIKNLTDWRADVERLTPKLLPLADIFIQACEGGKRLRGALVKLGYELSGGEPTDQIYKSAAAFEMFQTAILAHDDIVDQSPLRRGKPTVYAAIGGDHYAVSQAMTLGDVGFFLALRILADGDFPAEHKNKAIQSFCSSMLETASGQMLDIYLPHSNEDKTEEDAVVVFRLKTARYTISGPMELGAILAGADQKYISKLSQFGDNLGIAFQIQDDILGVFGDEKELGKSVTSDIEEGKNTLLITCALSKANDEQKQILEQSYGQGPITPEQLDQVKQIFIETGALDYSKQKALEYVAQAKQVIPEITSNTDQQQLLQQMAAFLVERSK